MSEKTIKVIIGCKLNLSAKKPVAKLKIAINDTKNIYRCLLAVALNVKRALAKKEKVTATMNAMKLLYAWFKVAPYSMRKNTNQCMAVLITPILTYLPNRLKSDLYINYVFRERYILSSLLTQRKQVTRLYHIELI